jgi:putative MATE family efflux protein
VNPWDNRGLLRLLWPLVAEQILAVTMGAADTIMVSSAGEAAVSGVNIIDNINNLFIIAFTALSTGGTVVVSQYIGRGDTENARCASRQLYHVVILAALGVMLPALIWRRSIIRFLYGKVAEDVMDAGSIYFFITALSYPFLGIYNACAALFRSAGNSGAPMGIALLVNCTNIAGNCLFIFGLGLGAEGAALATLSSRVIAASALTWMLLRSPLPVGLRGLRKVGLHRVMIRRILRVGIPSGLEGSLFQTGRLLTQRIFTSFGTAAIAGNAVAGVINSFSFMPGNAYSIALLTVVGQCIGAGAAEAAERNTATIMKLSWFTLLVLSALIFFFMEPLIGLFNLSPEAHGMAGAFLRVHCVSMVMGWSFSFALPSALRAAGDVRFVMIAAAVSMFAVRVSCAYLFTFVLGAGPLGVWIAMGLDFLSRGICYGLRWKSGRWKEKRVI